MDLEYAKKAVAEIEAIKGDDESAHSMEDGLLWEFVSHVATLKIEGVSDVAEEILKSGQIQFARWCA